MNASVDSQNSRRNLQGMYSKGLRNQIMKHIVNLYESNNLETQVIFPILI